VAGYMLISTDIRLFLSVAWLAPILFVLNRVYLRKSASMWQDVREAWTRVSTNLAENITGMRVVTAFNRQAPNLDVFNHLQQTNTNQNVTLSRVTGGLLAHPQGQAHGARHGRSSSSARCWTRLGRLEGRAQMKYSYRPGANVTSS